MLRVCAVCKGVTAAGNAGNPEISEAPMCTRSNETEHRKRAWGDAADVVAVVSRRDYADFAES